MAHSLPIEKSRSDEIEIVFADENAKIAWGVAQAVERVASRLPLEGHAKYRIAFATEHEAAGNYALLLGSILSPVEDDENVLLVSDRALQLLRELKIPYRMV